MYILPTFTELESLLLLQGFFFASQITEILFASGLIFLPLLSGVLRIIKNAKQYNVEYKISESILSYILFSAALIIFCLLPLFSVSTVKMTVNDGCSNGQSRTLYSTHTFAHNITAASAAGAALHLEDEPALSSLWWVVWHKLAGGITNTWIHKTPCHTDHHFVHTLLSMQTITSPQLRAEYLRFYRDCYVRAYDNYIHTVIEGSEKDNLAYVGNHFFLNTPGFYKKCSKISRSKSSPCYKGSDPGPSSGVNRWQGKKYPSCEEWWLGDSKNQGLRDLIYEEAIDDRAFCGVLPQPFTQYIAKNHKDELVRNILTTINPSAEVDNISHAKTGSHAINAPSIFRDFDAQFGNAGSMLVKPYFVKQFMTSLQPIVLMGLMIFFPIFFWSATYSIQSLVFYTALVLAVKLIPAIIIANNYLLNLLMPAQIPDWLSANLVDRGVLLWIGTWMPVVSSVIFIAALAWAGLSAGKAMEWVFTAKSARR